MRSYIQIKELNIFQEYVRIQHVHFLFIYLPVVNILLKLNIKLSDSKKVNKWVCDVQMENVDRIWRAECLSILNDWSRKATKLTPTSRMLAGKYLGCPWLDLVYLGWVVYVTLTTEKAWIVSDKQVRNLTFLPI